MPREAVRDKDHNGHLMIRCPECSAWDVAIDKPGTYTCEECDAPFVVSHVLHKAVGTQC